MKTNIVKYLSLLNTLYFFRGNFGNIGVYYDLPEIVPAGVQGDFRFNKSGKTIIIVLEGKGEIILLNFNFLKIIQTSKSHIDS